MTGGEGDAVQAPTVSWTVRIAGRLLGGLLTAAALAEAGDLYRAVGIVVFAEQRLLALLGLALGNPLHPQGGRPRTAPSRALVRRGWRRWPACSCAST